MILRYTGLDCRQMTWLTMQALLREIVWLRKWENGQSQSAGEHLAEMMSRRAQQGGQEN